MTDAYNKYMYVYVNRKELHMRCGRCREMRRREEMGRAEDTGEGSMARLKARSSC